MNPNQNEQQPDPITDGCEGPALLIGGGGPPEPPAIHTSQSASGGDGDPNKAPKTLREQMREPMNIFTFFIMLATFGQFGAAVYQWRSMDRQLSVMERQLKEAEDGSLQTDRIIGESEIVSDALSLQVDGIGKSVRQAQSALDASTKSSRLDQRAWVTVGSVASAGLLKVGVMPAVTIQILNSGKTPALALSTGGNLIVRPNINKVEAPGPPPGPRMSDAVLAPGVYITSDTICDEAVSTQGQIDAVGRNAVQLYLTGYITYHDIFGAEHSTTYCFRSTGLLQAGNGYAFAACDRWNTAN